MDWPTSNDVCSTQLELAAPLFVAAARHPMSAVASLAGDEAAPANRPKILRAPLVSIDPMKFERKSGGHWPPDSCLAGCCAQVTGPGLSKARLL